MEAVPQETVEKLMGNVPAQKELEGIRILEMCIRDSVKVVLSP